MKRTKIVCTIGPASESVDVLKKLALAGMNVCRLNFSHGDHEEQLNRVKNIKKVREELNMPIAIMVDTKGPEIRTGILEGNRAEIKKGERFDIVIGEVIGNSHQVSVSYQGIVDDVERGNTILIDDGLVALLVEEVQKDRIITTTLNDAVLGNKKGVNLPGVKLNLPAVTQKDIEDIKFAIDNDLDYIAASFVRKDTDVLDIRRILEANNGQKIGIISKIENEEGMNNLDDIIRVSDGIMVARGDLGVEIRAELMPIVQKDIIRKTNIAGKPVITATQMLDSMVKNPRPTRAEVTDVANAILDGTDAIMLSGETAAGSYPVEAVSYMREIAINTENSSDFVDATIIKRRYFRNTTTTAISNAAVEMATNLEAAAIVTATVSGTTALAISQFRPHTPILATTISDATRRKLALVWGVLPIMTPVSETTDEVIDRSIYSAMDAGYITQGDLIILTAGIPIGVCGATNLVKVHIVGDIVARGMGEGKNAYLGNVSRYDNESDFASRFRDGDIIIAKVSSEGMLKYISRAGALVLSENLCNSLVAGVAISLGKPVIYNASEDADIINSGCQITIDPVTGLIYSGDARIL